MNIRRMSIRELQAMIASVDVERYPEIIALLRNDPRGGVQRIVGLCEARLTERQKDQDRLIGMYSFERQVWAMGYRRVVGLDEAGRGPLAGPVVAGAVVLPREIYLPGLDDSKRVPEKRREELFELIREKALAVGVGMVNPEGIDEENILRASYLAMERAVEDLRTIPDYLLIDAIKLPSVSVPQTSIIGGDALSASIAVASIVAKVTRDRYMIEMDRLYPQYGFAANKGYGTPEHRQALVRYGPCPIHRLTFAPVREAARTREEVAGA